jgi:UDP-glucose 4-epimerase
MSRCCLIGGAGFIGGHLTRALLATGREVLVIDLRAPGAVSLSEKVSYLQGDIRHREFIAKALRGVDEIVDLAYSSVPKTSYDNPILDITDNLPGSLALFEATSALPIKKMLFLSSGGTIYGEPQGLPIAEDHPTHPISPYGITKQALEKYAQMYHRVQGLPIVCVRPSNPYGEGQRPFVGQGFIATAMASMLTGRDITIFGPRGTVRDYLYVEDLAKALVAACEFGVPGECYNIGSSIGRSNMEVIERIAVSARRDGVEPRVTHVAPRSFDVSANVLDTGKLNMISGWRPEMDFDAGIERTWAWYRSNFQGEAR